MLVLSRGRETEIYIGSDITIRVLAIHKGQVKLGIEAPNKCPHSAQGSRALFQESEPSSCSPYVQESVIMFGRMIQATLMIAAMSVPALGQDWATKMFETNSHDFGTVARGERAEFEFVLENLYVEDIHIAGVRASCSCTTPEIKTATLKTHQKGGHHREVQYRRLSRTQGRDTNRNHRQALPCGGPTERARFHPRRLTLQPGSVNFGSIDQGSGDDADSYDHPRGPSGLADRRGPQRQSVSARDSDGVGS